MGMFKDTFSKHCSLIEKSSIFPILPFHRPKTFVDLEEGWVNP